MRWDAALASSRVIALLACLLETVSPVASEQRVAVKIVGIGAGTCEEFVGQAKSDPPMQRLYLSWLQGYLSGLVIGRPPGVDEVIDLNPEKFPLRQQLTFIRDYCLRHPHAQFPDAVEVLFVELRTASKMQSAR